MNQKLVKLVTELNAKTGKLYKLDLYTAGYGLSLDHIIVAMGIKNITTFVKETLKEVM